MFTSNVYHQCLPQMFNRMLVLVLQMAKHVDIQALVEEWAWDHFRTNTPGRKIKKLLDKQMISMELDWKRVNILHEPPSFEPELITPGNGTPKSNVLFQTSFTNKTKNPQSYSFRTSRTTKSSCEVTIEESYTQGYEMEVTMKTPCEIFEANVGFSREMELTKSHGQVFEEELTWEVDNSLEVLGRHRAEAKVVILEEEYNGDFTIKSTIKGRVRAVFTNIKDNNAFIKATERDIHLIVEKARKEGRIKGDTMIVDGQTKTVICKTKGACKFKYGLKQDVEVDQFKLDEDE